MTPANDIGGMRTALRERLEESLAGMIRRHEQRLLRGAANAADAGSGLEVERSLADGYYAWADHLLGLERFEQRLRAGAMLAVEAEGLAAVEMARAEFRDEHPECPHCGRPQWMAGGFACWNCRGNLKGGEK